MMMKAQRYFIATSWNDAPVSFHFRALSRKLLERGHQVILLVDGQKKEVEDPTGRPPVYTWPSKRPVKLRDARFLFKMIRAHRPDCLIANFGSSNVMMLIGWLLTVSCRTTWYHTVSSAIEIDGQIPRWKVGLLRLRKRLIYTLATHIVPASNAAREDVHRVFHIPQSKCHVFYNSLADPLARPELKEAASAGGQDKVVCTGRLFPTKGQDVLIRAIALLKPRLPHLKVEFVGDGPSKADYQALAQSLGVAENCSFVGAVGHDEVLRRMATSLVTLVPSRSDNSPLVVIESLALGVPVVASSVGGIVESIEDGVEGFLVPPDDPPALAEKLRMLLTDERLRREMGLNARRRFLTQFEQGKVISQQAQWFENLVAGQSRV